MKSLTKREKTLLYILLCVLIFCCGVFLLVIPAMNKQTDLKTKYDNAQLELASVKASLPDYTNLDQDIKDTAKDLKAIKKKFYTNMKTEDIDKLITNLALAHNLTPTTLNIESEIEEVPSYADYVKSKEKTSTSTSTTTEGNVDSSKTLQVYNVTMTLSGTVLNLQDLVNEANHTKTMKIESVEYSEQALSDKTMKVTFKVFLI